MILEQPAVTSPVRAAARVGSALALVACLLTAGDVRAQAPSTELQQRAATRVDIDTGGRGLVGFSRQSGGIGMLRFQGARPAVVLPGASQDEAADVLAIAYGDLFGAERPAEELELVAISSDVYGATRYRYRQIRQGVPVFGGHLRVHFDATGSPVAINGLLLPELTVDPVPSVTSGEATRDAIEAVRAELALDATAALRSAPAPILYVYRLDLTRGRADGATHLVWEVVVLGNGLRELVYVDAHSGAVVDRTTGVYQELDRVVYDDGTGDVLRAEGDPPAAMMDVDTIFDVSGDTYSMYATAFGYTSWDDEDGQMVARAFWDDPICPNAVWTGSVTRFCEGAGTEDVVAHEWTHAYVQSTANLVYRYQSGALNEAYADIFGELVDLINNHCSPPDFTCDPNGLRSQSLCPEQTNPAPVLTVNEPVILAGRYLTGAAVFGPSWSETGPITGPVVAALDGDDVTTDGCQPIVNDDEVAGSIALVDRGDCLFFEKVQHAENAGAIAVIVVNNEGNGTPTMFYDGDLTVSIPSVSLGLEDGARFRASLPDVQVTIEQELEVGDTGMRWLIGEPTGSLGVIRDMWNPGCFSDPGRVGDVRYLCTDGDSGGVHTNSLVPSHAFALLVDGGEYNGRTIDSIGLIKASHIYWLALSAYSDRTTTFAAHADHLEAACAELRDSGVALNDHLRGAATTPILAEDCEVLAEAIAAVELREIPPCSLVLDTDTPAICEPGRVAEVVFEEDFEASPTATWTFENEGVSEAYRERDWAWVSDLPFDRPGLAVFADGTEVGNCGDDDQSGVVELTSPGIVLPLEGGPNIATFDHVVATEPAWDGGNLRVSVNGSPFELVETSDFIFNTYNRQLTSDSRNPLAGEPGFSGGGESGFVSPWGQSQIDLSALAQPGDSIRLQFRFGIDCSVGFDGWYVDNVAVAHCRACSSTADCADGDACTDDVCDLESGLCSNPASTAGTTCGDSSSGACDEPDSCDGAGLCRPNPIPANEPCGDQSANVCDAPDSCDGAGACGANMEPVGTACGDPATTECSAADSCDGAGSCRQNDLPAGVQCGDRSASWCTAPDRCDGSGICLPNHDPVGAPCGDRSDDDCTAPDSCDENGACASNHAPEGVACGDLSATVCTAPDACDGTGACLGNHQPVGTTCGDDTDDACTAPDTCDTSGVCAANHSESGTACGDPTDDACTAPDACDGTGVCEPNHDPEGTACGSNDTTECSAADSCDGGGLCASKDAPAGTACGDDGDDTCSAPDACDGEGSCDPNHTPDETVCEAPDACSLATCSEGRCESDGTVACDDGDPCTDDACDPLDGCVFEPSDDPVCRLDPALDPEPDTSGSGDSGSSDPPGPGGSPSDGCSVAGGNEGGGAGLGLLAALGLALTRRRKRTV